MCLGIPGQILEIINPDLQLALVSVAGVRRAVNIACIVTEEQAIADCVGDWVLIHVGFAISRLDPEEAEKTLQALAELAAIEAELPPVVA